MRNLAAVAFIFAPILAAQSTPPELFGVWKADLQASKFSGPPPKQYLEIIESKTIVIDRRTKESASAIEELSGVWGAHGQEREQLEFVRTNLSSGRSVGFPRV